MVPLELHMICYPPLTPFAPTYCNNSFVFLSSGCFFAVDIFILREKDTPCQESGHGNNYEQDIKKRSNPFYIRIASLSLPKDNDDFYYIGPGPWPGGGGGQRSFATSSRPSFSNLALLGLEVAISQSITPIW